MKPSGTMYRFLYTMSFLLVAFLSANYCRLTAIALHELVFRGYYAENVPPPGLISFIVWATANFSVLLIAALLFAAAHRFITRRRMIAAKPARQRKPILPALLVAVMFLLLCAAQYLPFEVDLFNLMDFRGASENTKYFLLFLPLPFLWEYALGWHRRPDR